MRRTTGITIVLFLAAIAVPPAVLADDSRVVKSSSAERDVLGVLHDWLDALARNDLGTVEKIVADDYVITAADGKVMGKTADLAPLKSGKIKFTSAEASDVNVRVFGDAAVVTGMGKYVVIAGGKTAEFRERFTDVYVKRAGRWQPVASHTTPLKGKP